MTYRIYLTFNPDEPNFGRKGQMGTWRVSGGFPTLDGVLQPIKRMGAHCLALLATRPYRKGVLVNPAKLALEYRRQHD